MTWQQRCPRSGGDTPTALTHYAAACRASALVLEREGLPHEAEQLRVEADLAQARAEQLSLPVRLRSAA